MLPQNLERQQRGDNTCQSRLNCSLWPVENSTSKSQLQFRTRLAHSLTAHCRWKFSLRGWWWWQIAKILLPNICTTTKVKCALISPQNHTKTDWQKQGKTIREACSVFSGLFSDWLLSKIRFWHNGKCDLIAVIVPYRETINRCFRHNP